MISLYKNHNVLNAENDKPQVVVTCNSDDTKPTTSDIPEITNGAALIEVDTGTIYFYDGANNEWNEA